MDLKRTQDENERQYIWRLCEAKHNGLLDLNWDELAVILNKELRGLDESDWYDSSAYRKQYQYASRYWEDVFSSMVNNESEAIRNINDAKEELYKAKVAFQDQRREYNKKLRKQARSEHLSEELIKAAQNLQQFDTKIAPIDDDDLTLVKDQTGKEAVLCLADWHYGMVTDNIWNAYDRNVCINRVSILLDKVAKYLKLHRPEKLHIILLGDMANGCIHTSSRVASEEDVCDQIMHVAELIAGFINALSQLEDIGDIYVYTTYGNHLRSVQDKKDSIHSDNMEKIIPWWLKTRLTSKKIHIIDSQYYEFIKLNVAGYNICCTHGDLDNFSKGGISLMMNTLFNKLYGVGIDYTISADKHHLEEFEHYGIESILIRSLCGTDNYANDRRLYSKPGQTLMIFTPEDGRQCTYNVAL